MGCGRELTVGRGNARPGLTTWRSSTYRPMKRNTEREEGKEVLTSCGRSTSDVGDVQVVDVETSSFVAVDKEKELPWHKPCASSKKRQHVLCWRVPIELFVTCTPGRFSSTQTLHSSSILDTCDHLAPKPPLPKSILAILTLACLSEIHHT